MQTRLPPQVRPGAMPRPETDVTIKAEIPTYLRVRGLFQEVLLTGPVGNVTA